MSIKERFGKIFGWVNGPYRAVAFVVIVILLILFGRDVLESIRVRNEIRRLSNRKEMLEQQIREDSTLLQNLRDPDFLERFAREKYLMRKEGEDVYIINEK